MIGTLRDQLTYPDVGTRSLQSARVPAADARSSQTSASSQDRLTDEKMADLLGLVGLEHLAARVHEKARSTLALPFSAHFTRTEGPLSRLRAHTGRRT